VFAVVGLICGIVAAILKLTNQHADTIVWLLIIGVIALGIEAVWGWHRAGYYNR
jgi:type III secretory pathway component EscS